MVELALTFWRCIGTVYLYSMPYCGIQNVSSIIDVIFRVPGTKHSQWLLEDISLQTEPNEKRKWFDF